MSSLATSENQQPSAPDSHDAADALIAAASEGNEAALRRLIEGHVDFVRRFLAQYVDDPGAVDDLCQETFIAMHRMLPSFRHASKFSTWLLGISRNLTLTFLRDRSRRLRREGGVMSACLNQWQSARLVHESQMDAEQQSHRMRALRECVETLSPTAQSMIQAYYFDNVAAEEIAKRTNRKSGTIRMTLLRIRKTLGQCIRHKTQESPH